MHIIKYFLIILLTWSVSAISAQEVLTGLSKNPVLKNAPIDKTTNSSNQKGGQIEIKLPMLEDFSIPTFYPNKKYWASKSVFINRSYAVNPPSIGVATFDAMNDTGSVYSHMGSFSSVADTLTTNNIRLDSSFGSIQAPLNPSDSVYLSFFVQPQGKGASPLEGDSLVLQFYNPTNSQWNSVWNIDGMSLDTFLVKYDTSFLQIMIPITNPDYFASDFRFRFYNYARIPSADKPSWRSGLHSHWNLDYVVLDANRSISDTSYNDMAIQTYQTTLLNDFQSMPWNQYQAASSAMMNYGLGVSYKNMDDISGQKNVNQYFYIYDLWTKTIAFEPKPNPSAVNISSQAYKTFAPTYSATANDPAFIYSTTSPKYPEFRVFYSIFTNTPPPDIISSNDTVSFYQKFYNYLSYDDGVAEAGYGLSTPGGRLAYKFTLNVDDTLQSIQMYFNQTLGNANQQYFYLTVWDDNNGSPGNVIYEKSGLRPEFENELFKYYTYILDNPIAVSGTFYVGWRQTTKDNLNVGFDFSNVQSDKIFVNVTGNWYNTGYKGSLMIRPILGQEQNAHVGVKDEIVKEQNQASFKIYPNPNDGTFVNLSLEGVSNSSDAIISIINLQGQIIHQQEYNTRLNTNSFSPGIYFIRVYDSSAKLNLIQKLIISR